MGCTYLRVWGIESEWAVALKGDAIVSWIACSLPGALSFSLNKSANHFTCCL